MAYVLFLVQLNIVHNAHVYIVMITMDANMLNLHFIDVENSTK